MVVFGAMGRGNILGCRLPRVWPDGWGPKSCRFFFFRVSFCCKIDVSGNEEGRSFGGMIYIYIYIYY